MREISKDFAIRRMLPTNHERRAAIKIGPLRTPNDREYVCLRHIIDLLELPLSVYARVAGVHKRPYTADRFEILVCRTPGPCQTSLSSHSTIEGRGFGRRRTATEFGLPAGLA